MNNILFYSQRRERNRSEIIESEITDWHSKPQQLRGISTPETRSHRGRYSGKNYIPKVCQLNTYQTTKANLAVDILKYQLSDRAARHKHLENVRLNLEHRLQVAKAQNNSQLVYILQDEYKQLETNF